MRRATMGTLLLLGALAVGPASRGAEIAGPAAAADDPLRDKALKLNQTTGTSAMAARLSELLKDEAAFKKFQEAQQGLSSALGRLLALAENYPNLKADQGFRDLQSQLEGTENRITVARKRYIDKVAEFNKMVRYFPTNLTAKFLLHLEEKANFTVADEKAVAKPPEVKF